MTFHSSRLTGRGMGLFKHIIFFQNQVFQHACSTGMPQGHILGLLPFFTLYPSSPLQPPCFYLIINMQVKFPPRHRGLSRGAKQNILQTTSSSALTNFSGCSFIPSLFQHLSTTMDDTAEKNTY